ncbi:MAG: polyphosphate polymerase domain-containing protein [Clostridia bacterium]|nr:polyphosphate polymerase domain-containing protein [Clostridia bacterium]
MAVTAAPAATVVVMKRYELKYILDPIQTEYFIKSLEGHMRIDGYGLTSVASLYYDTPDRRLIIRSIEKPKFKEKIRVRSYGVATDDSPVFLELKRKAEGVVYKRRVQTTVPEAERFFAGEDVFSDGQINREITFFRDHYGKLVPACMIICDRTAYYEPDGDLRLTIDASPRYRVTDLDLRAPAEGKLLLPEGYTVLEIKVQQSIPLWLSAILDKGGIYKASFSKYGTAYKQQMTMNTERGQNNV